MIKYAPRLPPAWPQAENKPLRGQRPRPSSTTRHAHPVCLPRWITDKDPSLSRVTDLGIFLSFPFSLYHRALPADIPASPIVLHSALLRLPSSRRWSDARVCVCVQHTATLDRQVAKKGGHRISNPQDLQRAPAAGFKEDTTTTTPSDQISSAPARTPDNMEAPLDWTCALLHLSIWTYVQNSGVFYLPQGRLATVLKVPCPAPGPWFWIDSPVVRLRVLSCKYMM
ncbi:hypothetical protein PCL_02135 [Purpureocillium lilacinum]|uniref:Uncharacterized protein n=1 Tax=Purpureocillium lilacinum TaxID=33203 RepID=A0A2U3E1L4_PURLI|nr:hypothetical protein PCL_02135 [Purpureocillium lilacinum]